MADSCSPGIQVQKVTSLPVEGCRHDQQLERRALAEHLPALQDEGKAEPNRQEIEKLLDDLYTVYR